MTDFLCTGDLVCLYCETNNGYVYNWQTCSANNGVYMYHKQDRERPTNIPNPQWVVFEVCIQNRYKLQKKYAKWKDVAKDMVDDLEKKTVLASLKAAAAAEKDDNQQEYKRQCGKRVRYGQIIQLRHQFTGKFIHVSTSQTSKRDKNNMLVCLEDYNAKHAQFRILPRYKVKSEGEVVQAHDQVVFESVKTPGQFLHASSPFTIDQFSYGSEVNLGIEQTGFTLVKHSKPNTQHAQYIRGGSVIRMFHKELEAYVVAEGLFHNKVTESVHLRVREVDQLVPKTLYPSTSAICYWQVQMESSVLKGDIIRWEQQVRFCHMTTGRYLCITNDLQVTLTDDTTDPNTVFRLHPVMKEMEEVQYESYARIEHVLTGSWLHALKDQEYRRRKEDSGGGNMNSLKWDRAILRQISASSEQVYHDAYTLQQVEPLHVMDFNFVAGMVPFLLNVLQERRKKVTFNARKISQICSVLVELKDFLIQNGVPSKNRQKLMRNLRIIDILVQLLQFPVESGHEGSYLLQIFQAAYDVLHAYMCGNSRKNALYFAKYIKFFQTQFNLKNDLGLKVAQMIIELVRDNRQIVDRISKDQILQFIQLLRQNRSYQYLDLLNVLCVCNGVAIPDNQVFITENWLRKPRSCVYLLEQGAQIKQDSQAVFISTDSANSWMKLQHFANEARADFNREAFTYLEHQLDLFRNLCQGRNQHAVHTITSEQSLLTWETAFQCLQCEDLPDSLRARFSDIIIGLFVDLGGNSSVLDYTNTSFVYEEIDKDAYITHQLSAPKELVHRVVSQLHDQLDPLTIYPALKFWISRFLSEHRGFVASQAGRNMLMEQVLKLVHFLVLFGHYGNLPDIRELQKYLLKLLHGQNDRPFPDDLQKEYTKGAKEVIDAYQETGRFEHSQENSAIVNAKYQALQVLELLLTYQFNARLKSFVALFKKAEQSGGKKKRPSALTALMVDSFSIIASGRKRVKEQHKIVKLLNEMFESTAYFDQEEIVSVLMDLSQYHDNSLVTKSLSLLNKYFSSKMNLFKYAVQAQILVTQESCKVHREVAQCIPVLKRLAKARLGEAQVQQIVSILERLTTFCLYKGHPKGAHQINQNILISHGVLSTVLDYLSHDTDTHQEVFPGQQTVVKKVLVLLQALIRNNSYVQGRVFQRMEVLFKIQGMEAQVARTLKEAFQGNQWICLKTQPRQLQKIIWMVSEHQEAVPEYLDLLQTITKVQGLDLPLKRNQAYIIKFLMHNYSRCAYFFEQPWEFREKILTSETDTKKLQYLLSFVSLLATCAEGENRFIESLCQTIVPLEEILRVLVHDSIRMENKGPYLRYLHWVYMHTANGMVDTGDVDLPHDPQLWDFLASLMEEIEVLVNAARKPSWDVQNISPDNKKDHSYTEGQYDRAEAKLYFLLDSCLPFLKVFYSKCYSAEQYSFQEETAITERLTKGLMLLLETIREQILSTQYLKDIVSAMMTLIPLASIPHGEGELFIRRMGSVDKLIDRNHRLKKEHEDCYAEEIVLNTKFRTFAVNSSLLFGGQNSVVAQLKFSNKHVIDKEYTSIGSDEALPLGEEFQSHVRCFQQPQERSTEAQYQRARLIVHQLSISARRVHENEARRLEQEDLDMKCLQILRAMIHNEIVKLPSDWEEDPTKHTRQLELILQVQDTLCDMNAVVNVLPLLGSHSDNLVREVLAFLSVMLFNANKTVQKSMIDYFRSTREEMFFLAMRNRMRLSTAAMKERRALASYHEARMKEVLSQAKSLSSTMSVGRKSIRDIQNFEMQMKSSSLPSDSQRSLPALQYKASVRATSFKRRTKNSQGQRSCCLPCCCCCREQSGENEPSGPIKHRVHFSNNNSASSFRDRDELFGEEDMADQMELENFEEEDGGLSDSSSAELVAMDTNDEGFILLVLQVMARMCDGQFNSLQDYLREQPDNIKSFNLVAETAAFVNMVYSNINAQNIDLVIQLLTTLNEFASGNQANRAVIVSHKVVDSINFILRSGELETCSPQQNMHLRKIIGDLLYSLIEENGQEALSVAKEVKDTVDREALYKVMANCHEMHQVKKPRLDGLIQTTKLRDLRGALQSAKSLAKEGRKYMKEVMEVKSKGFKELLMVVGFKFYFILARLQDIQPSSTAEESAVTEEQEKAFKYYHRNSMSVELFKDNHLHKVYFRVKNKNVLREEVKDKLKWSVDRTSPSNKICDLMRWSKDILKDIHYQRRILSNWFTAFLTNNWLLWNRGTIILSLVINLLMLITWQARVSLADVPDNATALPDALFDPSPHITLPEFYRFAYILGAVHNLLAVLVMVTYFLSNHPQPPDVTRWLNRLSKCGKTVRSACSCCVERTDSQSKDDQPIQTSSQLDVHFFSLKTFYYVAFAGLSVAGTAYHGYFFAFHLLNIVNNNQLLKGVIQAVTQNGKSLLWVGVLGLVIFYLYSIIGFAWLRDVFDPDDQLYCGSLLECTVTIIRYGMVGDYDEMFRRHVLKNSFTSFLLLSLFQVSFFIVFTTIGLNIIFGIIVDTFSELRDLKWKAESDMRDLCFICSRKSHDFEHHGLGFSHHVKHEHNMWAYIFFFIHLDDTKPNDYTALELYVYELLQEERYNFFPQNRALSLSSLDEDSTESKIDELLHYVMMLVDKQRKEESERKRELEREEQRRWEQEHRAALKKASSMDSMDRLTPPDWLPLTPQRKEWIADDHELTHL